MELCGKKLILDQRLYTYIPKTTQLLRNAQTRRYTSLIRGMHRGHHRIKLQGHSLSM